MKSIRSRLLLLVAIVLAPALGLAAYEEIQARKIRHDLVEEEARRLVRLVSDQQQRIIDGAEQVLTVMTSSPAIIGDDPVHCQQLLRNLLGQSPRYLAAGALAADGSFRCSPLNFPPALNMAERPFFQRTMETGGVVVGDYMVGRSTGRPTLHIAKPIFAADRSVVGVAVLALNLDWLFQQLVSLPLPPGSMATVWDRNGLVLARFPGNEVVGEKVPAQFADGEVGNAVKVVDIIGLDGRARFVAYAPVGTGASGLHVAVGLDRQTSFAQVTDANRGEAAAFALVILTALMTTAVAGTRLIRAPFASLLSAADRWRSGDLRARTGLTDEVGEFGRLATAFDAMAVAHEAREATLRSALESTTDSVVVLDRGRRATFLNRHAITQLGDSDRDGARGWPFIAGDSVFGRAWSQAVETGSPARAEGMYPPLGRHFVVHAYPADDGVSLFFRDVTEAHIQAAALRESEERFRATFEHASTAMAQADPSGPFIKVNEAMCAITGYSEAELLGLTFQELTHPDDRDANLAQVMRLLRGEVPAVTAEKRYLRKDGGFVWVNRWLTVLRDADGKPERLMGLIDDISARKDAQAALEQSETRLRLAREAAGFGVWDRDLASGRIIWSEEQWRLRGMEPDPDGVQPETWLATLHPDDRDRAVAEHTAAVTDPVRPLDTVYRIIRPDGAIRWLLVKGTVVRDHQGKVERMVGLTMDVTESRETEAALRRLSNELEDRVREEIAAREAAQARAAHAERMQALGQLAAGIAHDFNNVLQMVMGAASLLEAEPADAAEVASLAGLIMEAADQGAATTSRLLTLGRHGDPRVEALDLVAVLRGLRDLLVHTLGAAIAVDVRTDADLPLVLADKAQLETSLVNLAINARDAMKQGGALTFSAADLPRDACLPAGLAPGHYVRLLIADTGSGMDAATLARVGQPFFTTKKAGAGNGLGVAMVKGFAEQSHGAMAIDSRPGEGTTVTLWLPAAPSAANAPAPQRARVATGVPVGASPTILLIDDEAVVRQVVARHLTRAGFQVTAASNGAEALALLDAGEPAEALVTDLSMPGIDGIALISGAQERRPGMPAILLTGYADSGINLAIGGAVSGSYSLLRKPISGAQLVERVRALLAGRAGAEV